VQHQPKQEKKNITMSIKTLEHRYYIIKKKKRYHSITGLRLQNKLNRYLKKAALYNLIV
jgi:hypothetical protein